MNVLKGLMSKLEKELLESWYVTFSILVPILSFAFCLVSSNHNVMLMGIRFCVLNSESWNLKCSGSCKLCSYCESTFLTYCYRNLWRRSILNSTMNQKYTCFLKEGVSFLSHLCFMEFECFCFLLTSGGVLHLKWLGVEDEYNCMAISPSWSKVRGFVQLFETSTEVFFSLFCA